MKGKLSAFCWQFFLHQLPETKRSWWKWLGCPCGEAWEPGGPLLLFERISIRGDWDSVSLKRWKVNSNFEKKKYGSWNQEKQLLKVQCKLPQAGWWGQSWWTEPEPGRPHRARSSSFPISGWSWGFCHVNVPASMGHWSLLGASAQLDLKWLEGRDPKREATSGLISCSQFSEKKNHQSALCFALPLLPET